MNNLNVAFQMGKLVAALVLAAGFAAASPVITVLYDPTVIFSSADKLQIQNAIDFYTANITSTFDVTIAVGSQAGGGASTSSFSNTVDYSTYYDALAAHSSGNATDTTAIASLGVVGAGADNPLTPTKNISLKTNLAAYLGLVGSPASTSFSNCGNLTANACIDVGTDVLNAPGFPTGTPNGSLMGTFEHDFDEVLGTPSALSNGVLPTDPSAADLFRYSAPGPAGRSFALNASTDIPCTGSPTAYFSIDGGVTNLNPYNNCNNGGDYGDWIFTNGLQVQDAFGPDDVASSLNLSSPEVTLLDAVGYNFSSASTTPEPSSVVMLLTGLAAIPVLRKRLTGRS